MCYWILSVDERNQIPCSTFSFDQLKCVQQIPQLIWIVIVQLCIVIVKLWVIVKDRISLLMKVMNHLIITMESETKVLTGKQIFWMYVLFGDGFKFMKLKKYLYFSCLFFCYFFRWPREIQSSIDKIGQN